MRTRLNDMCIPIQVVLASMVSLEEGFSHDIFVEWATDAKNLVFFTERAQVQCVNPLSAFSLFRLTM